MHILSPRLVLFILLLLLLLVNIGCKSTGYPLGASTRETPLIFQQNLAKAEQGDVEAQYAVAKYYSASRNSPTDRTNAFKWFEKAATKGNCNAQTALGELHLHGTGTPVNFDEAVKLFSKAAAQGETNANAYLLGFAVLGLPVDTTKVVAPLLELRKMAENGNAVAESFIAISYLHGQGVTKDAVQAFKWFEKAALHGEIGAQAYVGQAYFHGDGVKRNYSRAIQWSRNPADQGMSTAQFTLGLCYLHGKGIRKDLANAASCFRKAAEQGTEEAQIALGLAYRDGLGVSKDVVHAYKWIDLAAAQGNSNALTIRVELASQMRPEQLALAGNSPRLHLTQFDRQIIDNHEQRYMMSCIPSAVEMVLKLLGRVPASYYEQQNIWKNKADGSFHDFDGKSIEGVSFRQSFIGDRNPEIVKQICETIHNELKVGRYVIVGLPSAGNTHDWVIYDETANGEFLAVSKAGPRTIENNHARQTIIDMNGTDLGTYVLRN